MPEPVLLRHEELAHFREVLPAVLRGQVLLRAVDEENAVFYNAVLDPKRTLVASARGAPQTVVAACAADAAPGADWLVVTDDGRISYNTGVLLREDAIVAPQLSVAGAPVPDRARGAMRCDPGATEQDVRDFVEEVRRWIVEHVPLKEEARADDDEQPPVCPRDANAVVDREMLRRLRAFDGATANGTALTAIRAFRARNPLAYVHFYDGEFRSNESGELAVQNAAQRAVRVRLNEAFVVGTHHDDIALHWHDGGVILLHNAMAEPNERIAPLFEKHDVGSAVEVVDGELRIDGSVRATGWTEAVEGTIVHVEPRARGLVRMRTRSGATVSLDNRALASAASRDAVAAFRDALYRVLAPRATARGSGGTEAHLQIHSFLSLHQETMEAAEDEAAARARFGRRKKNRSPPSLLSRRALPFPRPNFFCCAVQTSHKHSWAFRYRAIIGHMFTFTMCRRRRASR